MDTHDQNYFDSLEGKNLPIQHCKKNSPGWNLYEGIYKEGSKIIEKNFFGSPDLGYYIQNLAKNNKIEYIEFAGLCTDICVITNILFLKTLLPEIELRLDAKACAGSTKENHFKALAVMQNCQIRILNFKIKNDPKVVIFFMAHPIGVEPITF